MNDVDLPQSFLYPSEVLTMAEFGRNIDTIPRMPLIEYLQDVQGTRGRVEGPNRKRTNRSHLHPWLAR